MELNAHACAENNFSRIDLTYNVCVCRLKLLNVFYCMCAYKCTVHECMYVLCTRFHFCNKASVLYVSVCVCVCVCVCVLCV